jgi:ATP-binding cassette subfamily F protein 2
MLFVPERCSLAPQHQTGELVPLTGAVRPHAHLRISKFTQHFIDVLDLSVSPLDYFLALWPDMTREDGRKFLGR